MWERIDFPEIVGRILILETIYVLSLATLVFSFCWF